MKKQLLIGSALLASIGAFSQQRQLAKPSGIVDQAERATRRVLTVPNPSEKVLPVNNQTTPQENNTASSEKAATTVSWNPISGSMNIYGMLVSSSKPLHYVPGLEMVSFVHRKSITYSMSPAPTTTGAISGGIVGMVTSNWGSSWDSTLIWNNSTQWARYPQGGVWNSSPTNSLASNAYILGMGPVTANAGGWVGSFIASKQLGTYNNTASSTTGAQLYFPNTAPYNSQTGNFKFDFPRYDYHATNDGKVRTLGNIVKDVNATTSAAYGYRGARMVIGSFNSGVFNWTTDSIIPKAKYNASSGGKMMFGTPHMAWDEAGTIGYVFFIGVDSVRLASNDTANWGYQPIVYKTTNGGTSWSQVPAIDFTDYNTFKPVLDHIYPVNTNNAVIPFFTDGEGYDGIVDMNGDLHLVSTVVGTARAHRDSIGYTFQYNQGGVTGYTYPHRPGALATFYDFTFNSSTSKWGVHVVDSMYTEGPGTTSADPGFNENPWDPSTDKVNCDARMQLSRSKDGKYITYSWAESDTAYTDNNAKFNQVPDVYVRLAEVTSSRTYSMYTNEINISSSKNQIRQKATNHYVSPKFNVVGANNGSVTIMLPATVSNNTYSPKMRQDLPVTHWYSSAQLTFTLAGATPTGVNVAERTMEVGAQIFPNPASDFATVTVNSNSNAKAEITIVNTIGQVVKSIPVEFVNGENAYEMNISGLSSGIYMVTVTSGDMKATRKLIVE